MSERKTIAVLTATRAEYGLLRNVIKGLQSCGDFNVEVLVTGMHLSPEFGLTYKEIENDGIPIAAKIPILMSDDTPSGISKTMGMAMISFADWFAVHKTDMLVVLGDRYETVAVCCAAASALIPIAHISGGEATEGLLDECWRHMITKMSYLHFPSIEEYRKRIIQLGENPSRVFCVGSSGVENALTEKLMTREKLANSLDFDISDEFAVLTFHPVTLENRTAGKEAEELIAALDQFRNIKFIITKANSDADGRIINEKLELYANVHKNVKVFDSLGNIRYLSALKYALFVIGNSSSGIVEVPSFGIPTINIGDRQKGRIHADSVIDCVCQKKNIVNAIELAMSEDFKKKAKHTVNPYGNGDTSKKIVGHIQDVLATPIDLKKKFYDINIEKKADFMYTND